MSRLLLALTLILSSRAFANCKTPLSGVTPSLVAASNRVGFGVLDEAFKADSSRNTLISPLSLNLAMHLGLAGAAGPTADELENVLGVPAGKSDDALTAIRELTNDLVNQPGGEHVAIANGAWAHQPVWTFDQAFLTRTGAEAFARDFRDPATTVEMNDWAKTNTHGKISKIIDDIPPDVFFILTNALYFKAPWVTEFFKGQTKDRPFTTADGTVVQTPTMYDSYAHHPYVKGADFEAISLRLASVRNAHGYPMKIPGRFTLDVLLPAPGVAIDRFVGHLADSYAQLTPKLDASNEIMTLTIPKFKLDFGRDLIGDVSNQGVRKLFSESQADLSRMGQGPRAHVMALLQKVVAEMDEEGFEAAAVTSMMGGATSMPPPPKVHVVVDRPYVFALRDTQTGSVLFTGIVTDPRTKD